MYKRTLHFKNAPCASRFIRSEQLLPNPNDGFGFMMLDFVPNASIDFCFGNIYGENLLRDGKIGTCTVFRSYFIVFSRPSVRPRPAPDHCFELADEAVAAERAPPMCFCANEADCGVILSLGEVCFPYSMVPRRGAFRQPARRVGFLASLQFACKGVYCNSEKKCGIFS